MQHEDLQRLKKETLLEIEAENNLRELITQNQQLSTDLSKALTKIDQLEERLDDLENEIYSDDFDTATSTKKEYYPPHITKMLGDFYYRQVTHSGMPIYRSFKTHDQVSEQTVLKKLDQLNQNYNADAGDRNLHMKFNRAEVQIALTDLKEASNETYQPAPYNEVKPLISNGDGTYHVNKYQRPDLPIDRAIDEELPLDPRFTEALERVFPDEAERHFFTGWMRLVAFDLDRLPRIAPMILGKQGTGKTFLISQVLSALVGKTNTTTCNFSNVMSQFTASMNNKRLVSVEENDTSNKRNGSNKIKQFVSNDDFFGESKGVDGAQRDRTFAMCFTDNDFALPFEIPATERRYWIPSYVDHKVNKDESEAFFGDLAESIKSDDDLLLGFASWLYRYDSSDCNYNVAPETRTFKALTGAGVKAEKEEALTELINSGELPIIYPVSMARELKLKNGQIVHLIEKSGLYDMELVKVKGSKGYVLKDNSLSHQKLKDAWDSWKRHNVINSDFEEDDFSDYTDNTDWS
ncbi:primase-helicase family protein [Vibrio campbellii]